MRSISDKRRRRRDENVDERMNSGIIMSMGGRIRKGAKEKRIRRRKMANVENYEISNQGIFATGNKNDGNEEN